MENKENYISFNYDSFCMLLKNISNSICARIYDLKDFFIVMDTVNEVLEDYKKQFAKKED